MRFLTLLIGLFVSTTLSAVDCPVGEYSDTGETPCEQCPIGTFAAAPGSTVCTGCNLGEYQHKTGQASCLQCTPGSYQDQQGQSTCIACAVNTYATAPGQTTCNNCAGMTNTDGLTGSNICFTAAADTCNAGEYQNDPTDPNNAATCLACPAGTFAFAGDDHCSLCAAGQYSTSLSSSICVQCSGGKSTNNAIGVIECPNCLEGEYATGFGNESCTQCAAGFFASNLGSESCSECSAGTYAEGLGNSECSTCLAGTFSSEAASTECTACAANSFSAENGATECTACAAGTQADEGATECETTPGSSGCNVQSIKSSANPFMEFSLWISIGLILAGIAFVRVRAKC